MLAPAAKSFPAAIGRKPLLQIQGLGVRYGSHWALRDFDLDVHQGDGTAAIFSGGAGGAGGRADDDSSGSGNGDDDGRRSGDGGSDDGGVNDEDDEESNSTECLGGRATRGRSHPIQVVVLDVRRRARSQVAA